MPVKSPAANPTKATTPRKRRTRKTSTTAKATPKAVKKPVAKITVEEKAFDLTAAELKQVEKAVKASTPVAPKVTVTTFKGGKVVAKKTTLKRPSTARLISTDRYLKDIATRWQIHNYEIQELISDIMKGFEAVKPYHAELVKLVKN